MQKNQVMFIKLNKENHMTIDPSEGCRVHQLTLDGKKVISFLQNQPYLGSGSYLMFPWVNRITENPYKDIIKNPFQDGKGYPLHGLFAKTARTVKTQHVSQTNQSHIKLSIENTKANPKIHSFTQTFILSGNALEIEIKVIESKQDQNPYCFGYHPYFEMSKPLSQVKISTNLKRQLVLEEDLLLRWPLQEEKWDGMIDGKKKYDSLLQGPKEFSENDLDNFVELDDGVNKLRIESNLEFWQIYTPEDGKRIAIEPMSFHGNLYQVSKLSPQVVSKLPKSGKIRITIC